MYRRRFLYRKIGGSDFAKAVYAMAQDEKLIDVTRHQPSVKIVYP